MVIWQKFYGDWRCLESSADPCRASILVLDSFLPHIICERMAQDTIGLLQSPKRSALSPRPEHRGSEAVKTP